MLVRLFGQTGRNNFLRQFKQPGAGFGAKSLHVFIREPAGLKGIICGVVCCGVPGLFLTQHINNHVMEGQCSLMCAVGAVRKIII